LKSETLNRLIRLYKQIDDKFEINTTLKKIQELFSPEELKAIANGGRIVPGQTKVPVISFEGQRFRIAHISDTHIGSIYFIEKYFLQMIKECKQEAVELLFVTGDVTEGMSGRDGHIYELSQIGFDAQRKYAIDLFSQWDKDIKFISGNHDRWYLKRGNIGANIVNDIANACKHGEFLGHDEGDMSLKGKVIVRGFHGEDGSSYAYSYRIQKIVESFSVGEKPKVLLTGHDHKNITAFPRGVFAIGSGALSIQSRWMRSKKIENHCGFRIIDIWVNDKGVAKLTETFYPFYA
jgi:predicted phosphodiesterase